MIDFATGDFVVAPFSYRGIPPHRLLAYTSLEGGASARLGADSPFCVADRRAFLIAFSMLRTHKILEELLHIPSHQKGEEKYVLHITPCPAPYFRAKTSLFGHNFSGFFPCSTYSTQFFPSEGRSKYFLGFNIRVLFLVSFFPPLFSLEFPPPIAQIFHNKANHQLFIHIFCAQYVAKKQPGQHVKQWFFVEGSGLRISVKGDGDDIGFHPWLCSAHRPVGLSASWAKVAL